MTTDTSEAGLERLICVAMTGSSCDPAVLADASEPAAAGGTGWIGGSPGDYDREYAVDLAQLAAFLARDAAGARRGARPRDRRPDAPEVPCPPAGRDQQARRHRRPAQRHQARPARHRPLLRHALAGQRQAAANASPPTASASPASSATAATRRSSPSTSRLFINGLPVATFELKNSLTKQTVADAVEQYKRDRDPRERLFEFGRCLVHFAVDDHEVRMCTHLKGKASWFLPFNQGWNDGAGNPPNPDGLKTDYLWKQHPHAARASPTSSRTTPRSSRARTRRPARRSAMQIFPRYHQLDVVRKLLADAAEHGAGHRYLIQHSAGSGKSQLHRLARPPAHRPARRTTSDVFDSIIVVTDRRILDKQIRDTIKQFAQVGATVGHADHSGDLRHFIEGGKKIIISTVQKFPFILDEIGDEHRGRTLRHHHRRGALQPGRQDLGGDGHGTSAAGGTRTDEETFEDADQPHHGGAQAAAQRELLRLHGHAQEQDAGDLRRALRARADRSSTAPSTATR